MDSITRLRPDNKTAHPPSGGEPVVALASRSPRRLEILEKFGFRTVVVASSFDERTLWRGLPPEEYASCAARGKALGVVQHLPVVAGDTVVVVDGHTLGKPSDAAEAASMLRRLSGREHAVVSAVVLRTGVEVREAVDRSRVLFRDLSEAQIAEYVATGEPLGKAGAYAIQGEGSRLVAGFSGSYWNIVGFPIEIFMRIWRERFPA
ncbi:MAG: septum formation protein Maf [Acidobacteria bacterium]|nr:septum formation protein Maf [Acidobacteriota bacterium]